MAANNNQRITILGYAKSTKAAIDYLLAKNYQIKVIESKSRDSYDLAELEKQGVNFEFAGQSFDFTNTNLVLTSPGIPQSAPVMQALRAAQAKNPKLELITDFDLFTDAVGSNYIAVTGTNGKTTTTSLLAHLIKTEPLGNIGKPFMEYQDAPSDRPYVIEISSFQLFYSQLKHAPRAAIYLNFTPDHMDWHKDLDEYKQAKAKLFTNCPLAILNYDDAVTRELGLKNRSRTRFFSTENQETDAFFKDNILFLRKDNNVIPLIKTSELQIVGEHNYSNALAAILAADAAGISLENIQTQLKSFSPVPHRMEYVATIKNKDFYNDSKATNPESAEKALKAFPQCIAIVGGKNKKLDMSLMLDVLIERAEEVICIGELALELAQGLRQRNYNKVQIATSLENAVERALKSKQALPVVFTPGTSSFDMFLNYEDRGDKFKAIVQKLAVS